MDREKLILFINAAERDLASVRSSLLILAQTGDLSELSIPLRNLDRLNTGAAGIGLPGITALVDDCEASLNQLALKKECPIKDVYDALDIVASIEAALFDIPLEVDPFLSDVANFVDTSFDELAPAAGVDLDHGPEEFEIDEETLDVFRSEADELLANIADDLRVLSNEPGDQKALWSIRRHAHTFKGAAGIIGLKAASEISHRMEDLLDKMVEMRREAVPEVIDFLDMSAGRLHAIVAEKHVDGNTTDLESKYGDVMSWLSLGRDIESNGHDNSHENHPPNDAIVSETTRVETAKTASAPIVRVSLDRLDDLLDVSRSLIENRSEINDRMTELDREAVDYMAQYERLTSLIEVGRRLSESMHAKLLRIRMVKFGTLETRLSRAVHVTCIDEDKKAAVEIENGDIEIDTQIIDALIEPLVHLIKNAVVHGIESPETRRMIGKPECGKIIIRVESGADSITLAVKDDGSGISTSKLKEKAVASGIIDSNVAASMDDREATMLIFDRGLTTAAKIDLNAGRGVGMSIVKESVESHGGIVTVETEPQHGTTFTISMPLAGKKPKKESEEIQLVDARINPLETVQPLVMVVDDSASIRHQTAKLVKSSGLSVITANDGTQALELLLSGASEPDLILSDVEMPQIDGWEFLKYLKADERFRHIPVVMVTSLDSDEHRQRALNLGALDYIVKPFSKKEMERVLEDFCQILTV